jgi:hypothetical protein
MEQAMMMNQGTLGFSLSEDKSNICQTFVFSFLNAEKIYNAKRTCLNMAMFIETWQYPEAPVFTANSWDRWLDDPSPE